MADSIVDPSSSASVSSISPLMQNQQTVNLNVLNSNIIPIISADIQVDTASSQSNPRPPPINQSASNNNNNANLSTDSNTAGNDEPEIKRKRTEPTAIPSTSQTSEKLESRLGGILCCAVCLDLPKTAMYQVRVERNVHTPIRTMRKKNSIRSEMAVPFRIAFFFVSIEYTD